MSDEIKNVTIIGAGGNLGPHVLNAFLKSDFTVSVLSRSESKSTFPSGVRVLKSDYSSASLTAAFADQDAVISLVGTPGFSDQQKLIDAAIEAGVKRFIPSEFGSSTDDERVRAIVPMFEGKRKVVEYLKTKEGQISWTAVITSGFFDWGLKVGFLAFDLQKKKASIWNSGDIPFAATNLSIVGAAVVSILSPKAYAQTANKYVYVASHIVTQNQLLSVLEKVTGDKWSKEHVDYERAIADANETLKKGDVGAAFAPLVQGAMFGDERALADFRTVDGGLSNELLGLPEEDLEEDVRAVVEGRKP